MSRHHFLWVPACLCTLDFFCRHALWCQEEIIHKVVFIWQPLLLTLAVMLGFERIKAELCFLWNNIWWPAWWMDVEVGSQKGMNGREETTVWFSTPCVGVCVCGWRPVYPRLQWQYCSQILRPNNCRHTRSAPTQLHDYCHIITAST